MDATSLENMLCADRRGPNLAGGQEELRVDIVTTRDSIAAWETLIGVNEDGGRYDGWDEVGVVHHGRKPHEIPHCDHAAAVACRLQAMIWHGV